ncbi:MAG: hypothetical protein KatS3mg108_1792 [Isosphaeraceae bacterium]|nr:MAG: hypothetical protein KatS3mg108_1792 [Isosphaeraceae bacterium]
MRILRRLCACRVKPGVAVGSYVGFRFSGKVNSRPLTGFELGLVHESFQKSERMGASPRPSALPGMCQPPALQSPLRFSGAFGYDALL